MSISRQIGWSQESNLLYDILGKIQRLTSVVANTSPISGGVPPTRNLSINGITYDLSADRSWTVGDILSSGSYSDPSWITGLAWSKLSGVPSTFAPSPHTHPLSDLTQSGATNGQIPQWNGSNWVPVTISTSGWGLTGNSGTTPTTNFIGTIDNQDFVIRTNNFERIRIIGNVGDNVPEIQFRSQNANLLSFQRVGNNGASINAGQNNELFLSNTANGRVHIGTGDSNQTSALLHLRSTTRGFLLSRMTTTERNAISTPANGLQVYNTTTNTIDLYQSAAWQQLLNTAGGQLVTGQLSFNHSSPTRFVPTIMLNGAGAGMGFWNTNNNSIGVSAGNVHLASFANTGVLINPNQIGSLVLPTTNAALEVRSTTRGFLPPKMTTAERDAVTWVAGDSGMVIYNTTTNTHQGWNGTTWNNFY
jgi:hypothetical protein